MTVESISKKNSGTYLIVIDGNEYCTTANTIADFRLYIGKDIDFDTFNAFLIKSQTVLAKEKALQLVSSRMMSEKELLRKLIDKGFDPDIAKNSASWMKENGYLDDERYAQAIARHYSDKGYGPGKIRSELIIRGINKDISESVLDSLSVSYEKISSFLFSRLDENSTRKDFDKAVAALYRRGYSLDDIKHAVASLDLSF